METFYIVFSIVFVICLVISPTDRKSEFIKEKFKLNLPEEYSYCFETEIMTVTFTDGSTEEYHGSCTIWRKMPSYKRCNTDTEIILTNYWTKAKHQRDLEKRSLNK